MKTKSVNYTPVHNTYGTQYGSTVTRHRTDAFRGTVPVVLVPRVALDPSPAFLTNLIKMCGLECRFCAKKEIFICYRYPDRPNPLATNAFIQRVKYR